MWAKLSLCLCSHKALQERAEGISEFLTSDGANLFKEGEKGRRALQEPRGIMYMRRNPVQGR